MQSQNKNKIVLHACCGICSSYPVSYLKEAGYDVVVYFYNPNIYPETEYQKRLEAEKTLCENYGVELVEGEYDTESFYACAKGLENEPEKGKRCVECFAQKHCLEYLDVNFRKKDGFLKTNQISRGLGLYRQNYCGCEFSVRYK